MIYFDLSSAFDDPENKDCEDCGMPLEECICDELDEEYEEYEDEEYEE